MKISIFPNFTFERMWVNMERNDAMGQHHPHASCCLRNIGNLSNPSLEIEEQVNGICQYDETESIIFTAEKVPVGNYSIAVEVKDDRCESNSIWTEKDGHCIWRENKSAHKSDDVPIVPVTGNASIWSAIIISVILIHLVIMIWFLIRRQKQKTPVVQTESVPLSPRHNTVNMLLLYPRDCFQFMKTMSAFRRLMECFHNVEVHDCHSVEGDLGDPLDWLRRVLSYRKLFIIVVNSHCARIIQEAIQSGEIGNPCNFYRNPTFCDEIFPYGLKRVMNDYTNDVYRRIYVIGFDGHAKDSKVLNLPSSLRLYNMPEHLEALLREMYLEYDGSEPLHDTPAYLSLLNNVKSLKKYRLDNPEYLSQILNLS